ncbi:MAG: hypothetical protein RR922_02700 [Clostridia bacterium]
MEKNKNELSNNEKRNIAEEIMSHDMDLEYADELLIHDEYIPEYFKWVDTDFQKNKVDEIEKITEK